MIEAFEKAIRVDPGSLTNLLVFADWLEETGHAADYVRIFVEMVPTWTPYRTSEDWKNAIDRAMVQDGFKFVMDVCEILSYAHLHFRSKMYRYMTVEEPPVVHVQMSA